MLVTPLCCSQTIRWSLEDASQQPAAAWLLTGTVRNRRETHPYLLFWAQKKLMALKTFFSSCEKSFFFFWWSIGGLNKTVLLCCWLSKSEGFKSCFSFEFRHSWSSGVSQNVPLAGTQTVSAWRQFKMEKENQCGSDFVCMFCLQMIPAMNIGIKATNTSLHWWILDAFMVTRGAGQKHKNVVCISIAEAAWVEIGAVLCPARRRQEPRIASVFLSTDNYRQQYRVQVLKL